MEYIRKYWKIGVICILTILFISKCATSGNYERKYNKQVEMTNTVTDSLTALYNRSLSTIDSQKLVITSLEKQLGIYEDQNKMLNERNSQLASKKLIIKMDDKK